MVRLHMANENSRDGLANKLLKLVQILLSVGDEIRTKSCHPCLLDSTVRLNCDSSTPKIVGFGLNIAQALPSSSSLIRPKSAELEL